MWTCMHCRAVYHEGSPGLQCEADGGILVNTHSLEAHPTAKLLGTTISDRYAVYGVLGIGGFGEVYSAYDPVEGRCVAIKTIHSEVDLVAADALNRFRQEADLLRKLASPHVVEVYEIDQFDELLYMVLELVRTFAQGNHERWHLFPRPGNPSRVKY